MHDTNALVAAHVAVKMQLIDVMRHYAVGDLSVDMERLPGEKAVLTQTMDAVKASLSAINDEIATSGSVRPSGAYDGICHVDRIASPRTRNGPAEYSRSAPIPI